MSAMLKPEGNTVACLSVPSTPSLMGARRNSIVQMSAKLAALRGEHFREDSTFVKTSSNANNKILAREDKPKANTVRFMQKNGRCNIKQESVESHRRYLRDFFTTLVDMKWQHNLMFYVFTYIIAWSLLGLVWYLIALARNDIISYDQRKSNAATTNRSNCVENVDSYPTAFLFYIETETSIGYGHRSITENCPEAIIFFVVQALLGNILDAFMIGCVFIKISQPKNRATTLVFSKECIISTRDKKYCLLFRVANLRNSLMVQCRIRAKLVKSRQTQEGEFIALHQDDINVGFDSGADNLFLVTPLIICHEIDEDSPFYCMSSDDIKRESFEIIVILEGMIESTGMICQARTSYLNDEVLWGYRFVPVLDARPKYYQVDHSSFNQSIKVNMPSASMKEFELDIAEKGSRSKFYSFVAPKMNMTKKRKDVMNKVCSIEKSNSGTSSTYDRSLRVNATDLNPSTINSTTNRNWSETSVGSRQENKNPLGAMNAERLRTQNEATSNRDDDCNEKRLSGDVAVEIKD